MHQSVFTYNLSRPYPYRWFTWVVVIGGIAVTALFSVISVAANGYDSVLVTVANPNETENPSTPVWFQKQPWSLANKITSKCQDQVFNVGSDIYTSALGFKHLLQYISQESGASSRYRNSLAYHHDNLQNCSIGRVTIAAWPSGFNVSFLSECVIYDNHIPTWVEFWTTWDQTFASTIVYDGKQWPSWFLWGNLILDAEELTCYTQMTKLSNASDWMARIDYFILPATQSSQERTVLSSAKATYDNVTITSRIGQVWLLDSDPRSWPDKTLASQSNVSLSTWSRAFGLNALSLFDTFAEDNTTLQQPWNITSPMVSLTLRADNIARLLYSAIMSDFGQVTALNMFKDPQLFFNYADAVVTMNKEMGDNTIVSTIAAEIQSNSTSPDFEFNQTTRQNISSLYDWANISAPSVIPSYLNTLYLCQVPKMKPVLSLIFAVIIADLVFLQALWLVFGFLVKLFLERRDDTANYCSGCADMIRHDRFASNARLLTPDSRSEASIAEKTNETSVAGVEPVVRRRQVDFNLPPIRKDPDESITLLFEERRAPPSP